MKILHISTPETWRGGEQQLSYLASELEKKEVEQYFVCHQAGAVADHCIEKDYPFFGIKPGLLNMYQNATLVKRICTRYGISCIHTHDSKAHTIAYISSLLGNPVPVVVSRRVDFPVGKSAMSRRKYNHRKVKAIICVSKAVMEITGRSITDKSVLKLVYDGIETNSSHLPPVPDLYQIFNIPKGYKIIGNVAALAPHKDYFTWLDAAAILAEKNSALRFLILGDGPLKEEIRNYVAQKDRTEEVILAGFREDAKELMQGFDIFLNTSETEGLGSSILDAFVRRIPVVATAAGGIPEIVIHEKTGLLAPVKQPEAIAACVERLIKDGDLRAEITQNAGEFVKNFDISVMAAQTLVVYKSVIISS